jgi:hypothetical protein
MILSLGSSAESMTEQLLLSQLLSLNMQQQASSTALPTVPKNNLPFRNTRGRNYRYRGRGGGYSSNMNRSTDNVPKDFSKYQCWT